MTALWLARPNYRKTREGFDTDVELDVYNLGLIYEINLDETGLYKIVMTFTDTACDCAESLPYRNRRRSETNRGYRRCQG